MDFVQAEPVLRTVSWARARAAGFDLETLAGSADLDPCTARLVLDWASRCGLVDGDGRSPSSTQLTQAGWQYLDLEGQVSVEVLNFLPRTVNDLHARRALLVAGADAVSTFRGALLSGTGIEHARDLLPEAFFEAVDLDLALGLYAASAAALARLSSEEAVACIAEEIVLVNLIDEARKWLLVDQTAEILTPPQVTRARQALVGVLELLRDPALPGLFAGRSLLDLMGTAAAEVLADDYPPRAWFRPYPGSSPTGHLDLTWN